MSDGTYADDNRRVRGEGELTADLILAAKAAEDRLSQQQIDSILGVPGDRGAE